MKGTIFDIKRFAVHDGPGVRTTLFLKGCPLRCRWCHNPEGVATGPQLAYCAQKCLHCGECVDPCPHGAHSLVDGKHVFERARCVVCAECVETCLGRALKRYGREISVEEAREIVLEDRDFYRAGGGVTLSGGEPLLQAEFCAELLRTLKADGLSCALDTSGAVEWESFEKVLPYADIVLYDVKHVDDALHTTYVGTSSERILRNLETLSERDVSIEVRVPLIPDFNLDEKSLQAIGRFLTRLKRIVGVRLLPYHPAHSKSEAVGKADSMPDVGPPSVEQLKVATDVMESLNLRVV